MRDNMQPVCEMSGQAAATKRRGGPSLSVIIPTRNEETRIGRVLKALKRSPVLEVLVVDGESSDQTAAIARAEGARVLFCPPSRGIQLNAGARAARGELLVFLHADTIPPPDFIFWVQDTLARPGVSAGAFRMRLEGPERSFRLIEWMINLRACVWKRPFGDQALFMRAKTFHKVGGFPDYPILEDYEIVRRLKRVGKIQIARASVLTSARRWHACGVWATTLRNQFLLMAYRLGVSPERIAPWR